MKLLVAGGNGFLGRHLAQSLINLGHDVVVVDVVSEGIFPEIICDIQNLSENDLQFDFDGIFNLAANASPSQYQKNPIETLKTNVIGTLRLAELATKRKIRFLQASTSEVYGDPEITPQSENYFGNVNPNGLRSCYDEGKRAAETLLTDFHRMKGLDIRIARIFNTYGPGMKRDDGRVVSNFIIQALNNTPITIYGDGTQIRSFCYMEDTIRGLIKLFFTSAGHDPINIGNPDPITMIDLANRIIFLTESSSEIIFKDLPSDDPKVRIPQIFKAQQQLNWNPEIPLIDGLERTISYFQSLDLVNY
jgi:UDP-glucuronate decarboxylase